MEHATTNLSLNPRTWAYGPARARRMAERCKRYALASGVLAFALAILGSALAAPIFGVAVLLGIAGVWMFTTEAAKLNAYAAGFERGQVTVSTFGRRS